MLRTGLVRWVQSLAPHPETGKRNFETVRATRGKVQARPTFLKVVLTSTHTSPVAARAPLARLRAPHLRLCGDGRRAGASFESEGSHLLILSLSLPSGTGVWLPPLAAHAVAYPLGTGWELGTAKSSSFLTTGSTPLRGLWTWVGYMETASTVWMRRNHHLFAVQRPLFTRSLPTPSCAFS